MSNIFNRPPRIDDMITQFTCGIERCDLVGNDKFCNRYLQERVTLLNSPCFNLERLLVMSCCLANLIIDNIAENDFEVCDNRFRTASPDIMKELAAAIRLCLQRLDNLCPDEDEEGGPYILFKFVIPVWVTPSDLITYVYHIVFSFEKADNDIVFTSHNFVKNKSIRLAHEEFPYSFFQGIDIDTTYGDSMDSANIFGNADDVFVPLPLTDYYDYC